MQRYIHYDDDFSLTENETGDWVRFEDAQAAIAAAMADFDLPAPNDPAIPEAPAQTEAEHLRISRVTAPAGEAEGAKLWIALVTQKAEGARENAEALRKYPGNEAEARARELAASYLMEMAQCLAMDETHAEMLEGVAATARKLAKIRAEFTL